MVIEFVEQAVLVSQVKDVTRRLAEPQVGKPLLVWPQIGTRARNGVEKNYERGRGWEVGDGSGRNAQKQNR